MRHTKGARLRAARALGGYKSHAALAKALNLSSFGERTIRETEKDKRELRDHERDAVARLIHVSPAFFEVDLEQLDPETDSLTPESLRSVLQQALERVDQVAAQAPSTATTGPGGTDREDGATGVGGG